MKKGKYPWRSPVLSIEIVSRHPYAGKSREWFVNVGLNGASYESIGPIDHQITFEEAMRLVIATVVMGPLKDQFTEPWRD